MQRFLVGSLLVVCLVRPGHADVKIASAFSDHMVLQRDRPIPVWGTAAAGAIVKVQLGEKSAAATADDKGRWLVHLPAMAADMTPQKLSASSGEDAANVQDILIGDVWL